MKIVVIGGTGLIGTKAVNLLRRGSHDVVAASRKNGIDIFTGVGLDAAVAGAQVVIDVSNAPSSDAQAVLGFFETAGRNLLAAEETAGVHHHVVLSIVGVDKVPGQGYYRAKVAQEKLVQAARVPYSIIRATQFLDSCGRLPMPIRTATSLRCLKACFNRSRLTMSRQLLPRWRWPHRETKPSLLQARNVRRSPKSSTAI